MDPKLALDQMNQALEQLGLNGVAFRGPSPESSSVWVHVRKVSWSAPIEKEMARLSYMDNGSWEYFLQALPYWFPGDANPPALIGLPNLEAALMFLVERLGPRMRDGTLIV